MLSFLNHLHCAFAAQVKVGLALGVDVRCVFRRSRFFAMVTLQKRFLLGVYSLPHDVKPSFGGGAAGRGGPGDGLGVNM